MNYANQLRIVHNAILLFNTNIINTFSVAIDAVTLNKRNSFSTSSIFIHIKSNLFKHNKNPNIKNTIRFKVPFHAHLSCTPFMHPSLRHRNKEHNNIINNPKNWLEQSRKDKLIRNKAKRSDYTTASC